MRSSATLIGKADPCCLSSGAVAPVPSVQEIEIAFRANELRRRFLTEDAIEPLSGKPAACTGDIRESNRHDVVDQVHQCGVER